VAATEPLPPGLQAVIRLLEEKTSNAISTARVGQFWITITPTFR
jgi:hypothetical protein